MHILTIILVLGTLVSICWFVGWLGATYLTDTDDEHDGFYDSHNDSQYEAVEPVNYSRARKEMKELLKNFEQK